MRFLGGRSNSGSSLCDLEQYSYGKKEMTQNCQVILVLRLLICFSKQELLCSADRFIKDMLNWIWTTQILNLLLQCLIKPCPKPISATRLTNWRRRSSKYNCFWFSKTERWVISIWAIELKIQMPNKKHWLFWSRTAKNTSSKLFLGANWDFLMSIQEGLNQSVPMQL